MTDATITRPTETEAAEKVEQSHEEDQSQVVLINSFLPLFNTA